MLHRHRDRYFCIVTATWQSGATREIPDVRNNPPASHRLSIDIVLAVFIAAVG
ncbi:MAG: hypothetical protein ACI915_004703, partial [Gammaproteobacteria bacterium]